MSENRHGTGPLYIRLLPLCLAVSWLWLLDQARLASRPIRILASLISLLPSGRIGPVDQGKLWNTNRPLPMVPLAPSGDRSSLSQASEESGVVRWIATTPGSPYHHRC